MNFQNKVAVITGSTAGIGEAVTQTWREGRHCIPLVRGGETKSETIVFTGATSNGDRMRCVTARTSTANDR